MADQDRPLPPASSEPSGSAADDPALARLGQGLQAVRDRQAEAAGNRAPDADPRSMQSVGKAYSLAIEMVASVCVSVFIGWWLDRWLGTAPWGLLGFILLGVAAAMWSAIRTAMNMQARQQAEAAADEAAARKGR